MATTATSKSLSDPALKALLQNLRRTDNVTNWFHLFGVYFYLAIVIGLPIWFFENRAALDLAWWWNVPVALAAIVLVGAGQHRLSGLAHEGSHHILFRGRYLNDLAADLLTMYPLFSSIYFYRLQHLAHHQFVNDPDRDPDVSQLQTSGHWLNFPVPKRGVIAAFLKQLWIPRLIRFTRVRAQYNATGTDKNPYMIKGKTPSKGAIRVGVVYLLSLIATLAMLFFTTDAVLPLALAPVGLFAIVFLVFLKLPNEKFHQSRLHPLIHARYTSILRVGYITTIFTTITVLTKLTGAPVVGYYALLWLVPLFTSFAFFMILRQIVQHGNGGRGWLTNTRTFMVGKLIKFSVFPMSQDYHLPHHLYATVPHYRLKKLHTALMEFEEYRDQAVVVEGYFIPPQPKTNPTVLEVLGPEYAPKASGVFIDESVMEGDEFEGKEELKAEGERLKKLSAS